MNNYDKENILENLAMQDKSCNIKVVKESQDDSIYYAVLVEEEFLLRVTDPENSRDDISLGLEIVELIKSLGFNVSTSFPH